MGPLGATLRLEDLDVWKRSARLSANIYRHMRDVRDFGFRDQITRSALSIPSNIAEGFERDSPRDCINFLFYAKGSRGATRLPRLLRGTREVHIRVIRRTVGV
jgi:hypothetical protein